MGNNIIELLLLLVLGAQYVKPLRSPVLKSVSILCKKGPAWPWAAARGKWEIICINKVDLRKWSGQAQAVNFLTFQLFKAVFLLCSPLWVNVPTLCLFSHKEQFCCKRGDCLWWEKFSGDWDDEETEGWSELRVRPLECRGWLHCPPLPHPRPLNPPLNIDWDLSRHYC